MCGSWWMLPRIHSGCKGYWVLQLCLQIQLVGTTAVSGAIWNCWCAHIWLCGPGAGTYLLVVTRQRHTYYSAQVGSCCHTAVSEALTIGTYYPGCWVLFSAVRWGGWDDRIQVLGCRGYLCRWSQWYRPVTENRVSSQPRSCCGGHGCQMFSPVAAVFPGCAYTVKAGGECQAGNVQAYN